MKINHLREENQKLKKITDQNKLPVYSEMKRKSVINENTINNQRDSLKGLVRQSLRNSITARTVLSDLNSNISDKNDRVSTCFDYEQNCIIEER